jgi:hypothetical protein
MPILLAGCASDQLVVDIDSRLKSNATVYEVTVPYASNNVSFGPYRVEGADKGLRAKRTRSRKALLTSWLNEARGIDHYEVKKIKRRTVDSFKFMVGDVVWDPKGVLLNEDLERTEGDVTTVDTEYSSYTCRFTRGDKDERILSIEQVGFGIPYITMTYSDKVFNTQAMRTGYIWTEDGISVAAISWKENVYRVLLDKRNSEATNDALSMASAGC